MMHRNTFRVCDICSIISYTGGYLDSLQMDNIDSCTVGYVDSSTVIYMHFYKLADLKVSNCS